MISQGVTDDWILKAARVVIRILQVVVGFAALMIAVATVVVSFDPSWLLKELGASAGIDVARFRWLVVAGLLGGAVLLGLFVLFLQSLHRIIATVGRGDPFTPDNARRLREMAWLLLAMQLGAFALELYSDWIGRFVEYVTFDEGLSITALLGVLVLFILARVFQHGAALRSDLEGTV
ncbi:DUF2975 domain-containing protein [Sphingosinithalassobacter sp. CS137]|uniref:DUF2975 domain-containing protein n=1 Tax=Sphingosinithalassobacter sp. CS137 TaxID=2762748 RepID=UPI00165EBAB5|nr:DUF2975 domain-containing protein [Sphingosinithalassobacter sp. CS137]